MRCLLRTVSRKRKGVVDWKERVIDAAEITIGRAAGQDIFLDDIRTALQHAVIRQEAETGQLTVVALVAAGVRLDDKSTAAATLQPGVVFQIGAWLFGVMPPAQGYDLVLEMAPAADAQSGAVASLAPAHASRSRWRMDNRRVYWAIFGLVLAGFLLLPMLGGLASPVGQVLRNWLPFFSDKVWSTGAMARGHRPIANDCGKCHVTAFHTTPDSACMECHKDTQHHAERLAVMPAGYDAGRCQSCHKEHNGDLPGLVQKDVRLCTDCHADIKDQADDSRLQDVGGDFAKGHPEFQASFITHENGKDTITRQSMQDPKALHEHSNLYFPHKLHLDPAGVLSEVKQKPGDAAPPSAMRLVLRCDSCHVADDKGQRMLPVKFVDHCERCHKLTFEPGDPARTVPHGKAEDVLPALKQYYRQHPAALPQANGAEDEGTERGRPGAAPRNAAGGLAVSPGQQERRADEYAEVVGRELFEKRVCAQCHTVTRSGENFLSWEISKVRIAANWYPKASFSHRAHLAVACKDCHSATDSEDSQDVLIGGIAQCRDCHGTTGTANKVSSDCVACHSFHNAEKVTMDGKPRDKKAETTRVWHAGPSKTPASP